MGELNDATVIGVMSLETDSSYIGYNGKFQVISSNISKCGMARLDKCEEETTAKLMIEAANHTYVLTAFTPILQKIYKRQFLVQNNLCLHTPKPMLC